MAPSNQLRFDGKVAIVTGGGRGMGYGHAALLARRGACVTITDMNDSANEAVKRIEAEGGRAIAFIGDVSVPENGKKVVDLTIKTFGRIDIIVNNAGHGVQKAFEDTTLEEFRKMIDVHTLGAVYIIHAAWPHMRKQKYGRVINITSSSYFGSNLNSAYGTAKAALVGLALNLNHEGREYGIQVNALCQAAGTPLLRQAMASSPVKDWILENLPEEAPANVLCWLVHEDCKINGEYLSSGGKGFGRFYHCGVLGHKSDVDLTPEIVRDNFDDVFDESTRVVVKDAMAASDFHAQRHGLQTLGQLA
jgi:NAD(P)-dependent dehydrogenase (short-subunit alcohol dehydrogenase family)